LALVPGDISFSVLTIGQLDLIRSEAGFEEISIYEDINDPFGSPLIEINVIDPIDALNKYKITGSYDENPIEIKFKYELTGEIVGFKGKMHSLTNLKDNSSNKEGSLKSKTYQIRGIQEEYFKAQTTVEKHFSMAPTTSHVEKIFKETIKTEKLLETRSPSEPREMTFGGEHTIDVIQKIMNHHTSTQYDSSAYVIFQEWKNGNCKIIQTTYEQLFEQSPVAKLKENTTLNSDGVSIQDAQNSILYSEFDPSWSEIRPISQGTKLISFNNSTHTVVDQNYREDTPSKTPAWKQQSSYSSKEHAYYVETAEDGFNNGQKHTNSEAKRKRTQYLSHLAQGNGKIQIPGNPKISVGSIVELDIQKKTDQNEFGGEGQFNKKALVVSIKHVIKRAGENPRYVMTLELIKAGMEFGGNSA